MSKVKRNQYTNTKESHDYISNHKESNGFINKGESLDNITLFHKKASEIGITNDKISKINMIAEMLSKGSQDVTAKNVFDRMVELAFNQAVKISNVDNNKVNDSNSFSKAGTARVKINHFIKMIKEHNSHGENTLKITQTLIANGLTSGKNRVINLDKINCTDKGFFENGTGCNRSAIKKALLDNDTFKAYNLTLGGLSERIHNTISIKALEVA